MRLAEIHLSGGGDSRLFLVPEEVYDWIERTDTPGREGDASSWEDTAAPQCVLDEVEYVWVTIGSYENDRALCASCVEAFPHFDSHGALREYLAENPEIEVVGEYHGMIY